jgi:hypothetical protein
MTSRMHDLNSSCTCQSLSADTRNDESKENYVHTRREAHDQSSWPPPRDDGSTVPPRDERRTDVLVAQTPLNQTAKADIQPGNSKESASNMSTDHDAYKKGAALRATNNTVKTATTKTASFGEASLA